MIIQSIDGCQTHRQIAVLRLYASVIGYLVERTKGRKGSWVVIPSFRGFSPGAAGYMHGAEQKLLAVNIPLSLALSLRWTGNRVSETVEGRKGREKFSIPKSAYLWRLLAHLKSTKMVVWKSRGSCWGHTFI